MRPHHAPRPRGSPLPPLALPLLAAATLLLALHPHPTSAAPSPSVATAPANRPTPPSTEPPYPVYQPWRWNSTCKYRAFKVPIATFRNGTHYNSFSGYPYPLFPLAATAIYFPADREQWRRCFGPGEKYSNAAIVRGAKLPCMYTPSRDGRTVDYWEEQACDVTHRSNCYCYALDRAAPGYCSPGIKKRGRTFSDTELRDCTELHASLRRDGATRVTRAAVYSRPPRGTHYIAAAIAPSSTFGGDFHFWRLDSPAPPAPTPNTPTPDPRYANGTLAAPPSWSYKAGYTFARNTYRDGAPVPDVEDPAARGAYTLFCGYFDVNRRTHTLGWVRNNVPAAVARSYDAWRAAGINATTQRFPRWSAGWLALHNGTYVEPGWEDEPGAVRLPSPTPSPLSSPSPRSVGGSGGGRASATRDQRRDGALGGRRPAAERNNPPCPPGGCEWGVLPPLA